MVGSRVWFVRRRGGMRALSPMCMWRVGGRRTGIVPELYLAGLKETEREASWREWLTLDIDVFVAELEGEVVGFASGGAIRERVEGFDAELFAIYLLREAQGHGIGTALVRRLAGSLKERGFGSMVAWVLEDNASGPFYTWSGAVRVCSKEMEVGGVMLPVVAYGWGDLEAIAAGVGSGSV
ncbi:GNAT family N-acetyltransferase [Tunturibacter empetritectus]|uniref:GNAT superfamily N-acetyltransferase n=1 Tax=Tunturiibacter lichenicola TaxID=2051959 RepID=A0A7W8J7I2_9BACT|nr:GNAT family N-acetyltransferase [Edaphobacter lichenicola]MBB5344078.1 GNAT superfamily N-acetyltransferase [Edaphobacter lichenicola]